MDKEEEISLVELRESLKKKDYSEEELFNEFYEICKKLRIENTQFFNAAYKAIINKTKGPRLASLILLVGKDKVIELLKDLE